MENKWMKFFIPGISPIKVDADKALNILYRDNSKFNRPSLLQTLEEYVHDQSSTFNEMQKLKTFKLFTTPHIEWKKLGDRFIKDIRWRILSNQFDIHNNALIFVLYQTLLEKFYESNREDNENLTDKYTDNYYYFSTYLNSKCTDLTGEETRSIFMDIALFTLPYAKQYFHKYETSHKIVMLTFLRKVDF